MIYTDNYPSIHLFFKSGKISHSLAQAISGRAVAANVSASVNQLSHSSRLIERLVLEEKIKIVGSVLDLSTGRVKILEG